jgi:hypothetical protein
MGPAFSFEEKQTRRGYARQRTTMIISMTATNLRHSLCSSAVHFVHFQVACTIMFISVKTRYLQIVNKIFQK